MSQHESEEKGKPPRNLTSIITEHNCKTWALAPVLIVTVVWINVTGVYPHCCYFKKLTDKTQPIISKPKTAGEINGRCVTPPAVSYIGCDQIHLFWIMMLKMDNCFSITPWYMWLAMVTTSSLVLKNANRDGVVIQWVKLNVLLRRLLCYAAYLHRGRLFSSTRKL